MLGRPMKKNAPTGERFPEQDVGTAAALKNAGRPSAKADKA
jgi:hypothetical protein